MVEARFMAYVDVLVIGGTTGAVSAAAAAAEAGASVFLATPWNYLGEDMAGTYRLWNVGENADMPPGSLFDDEMSGTPGFVRPMHVKTILEERLHRSGADFLFEAFFIDTLVGEDGSPNGAVFSTPSGLMAVGAGTIIDAAPYAPSAKALGIFDPGGEGWEPIYTRITVGGETVGERETDGGRIVSSRVLPDITILPAGTDRDPFDHPVSYPAREYTLEIYGESPSPGALAAAEQVARDLTWTPEIVDASDMLHHVPRASIVPAGPSGESFPFTAVADRLYVLSGCAALSRAEKVRLLSPETFIETGRRVGIAAAAAARAGAAGSVFRQPGRKITHTSRDVRPVPYRSSDIEGEAGTVEIDLGTLPEWDARDVVVAGGGTGGAPAAVSSARSGADTLLLEYLYGLGGVGTLGLIATYYHGNRVGFTEEIDRGVAAIGGSDLDSLPKGNSSTWNIQHKMEWLRREAVRAGAEVMFGCTAAGAVVEGRRVTGVIAATPWGPGIVPCRCVVDATGSAVVAAAAGAECVETGRTHVAVQGTGLPPRNPGAPYTNTDYTFAEDTDVRGVTAAFIAARRKYRNAYDVGQLLDTRERRQIVGDIVLEPMDMFNERTFPDSLILSRSNFDSHGFTVHPLFTLKPPDRESLEAWVPLRALLPRGLDGVIVTGLAVSGTRDAMPVIRMQPDIQNQGFAAGKVAASAAFAGVPVRGVDIRTIQRVLVDTGILPPDVLTHEDSYPISDETLAQAAETVADGYSGLSVLLSDPPRAIPLLRKALERTAGDGRLVYAHILALYGDPAGAGDLVEKVYGADWDEGWNYIGMGQFGASMSRLDSYIIALGKTGDPAVLPPIMEKSKLLEAGSDFSHFRAVAVAAESIGDPGAAPYLKRLLDLTGVRGHAQTRRLVFDLPVPAGSTENETRNLGLREIILARALFRCGDPEGLGREILEEYTADMRGPFAMHARAVLRDA